MNNMIEALLRDLANGALRSGAREMKRRAKLKRNATIRPALDVVGQFLDALQRDASARRRTPKPAISDRPAKSRPDSPQSPMPAARHARLHAFIEQAAGFVSQHSGVPAEVILQDRAARDRAYREAAKRLHPDRGGDEATMQQLTAYWRVLKILDEVHP